MRSVLRLPQNAPKTIFLDRRIACFEPGWEASFLVLDRDPLEDSDVVEDIHLRVKQGSVLEVG